MQNYNGTAFCPVSLSHDRYIKLGLYINLLQPPGSPNLGGERDTGGHPQAPGRRFLLHLSCEGPLCIPRFFKQSLKLKAVHPLSTLPNRLVPGTGSHQVLLRHPEFTIYRCFLPDLTGFIAFCRAGPSVHNRWTENSPGKNRASSGDSIPL